MAECLEKNQVVVWDKENEGNNALMPVDPRQNPGSTMQNITLDKGTVFSNVATNSLTLVSNVLSDPQPTPQNVVNRICTSLMKTYTKMGSRISLPWLPNGVRGLEKCLYKTDLHLQAVNVDGRSIQIPTKCNKLENIFDTVNDLSPTRIILSGPTSFCMSMAMLQLCLDWSEGAGPAAEFKMVVLLNGLQLGNMSLNQLVIESCGVEGVADHEVLEVIKTCSKVLLILDDLPLDGHLRYGMRVSLNDVLQSKTYPNTHVLVASHRIRFSTENQCETKGSDADYDIRSTKTSCSKLFEFGALNEEDKLEFVAENVSKDISKAELVDLKSKFDLCFSQQQMETDIFLLVLFYVFLTENIENVQRSHEVFMVVTEKLVKDVIIKTKGYCEEMVDLVLLYKRLGTRVGRTDVFIRGIYVKVVCGA